MVIAGYWDVSAVFDDLALAALLTLPPPADGRLHLIADKTIKPKSGKKQPVLRQNLIWCIFNTFLMLLVAHTGNAVLQLLRS